MWRIAAACLLVSLAAPAASADSDLTVTIYGIHFIPNATVGAGDVEEGCAGATTGRVLLRFGTKVRNLGPDDLLLGDPGCPDCQTNPGAACTNPLFVCSAGLYVSHFRSAAKYELLDPQGTVVASGPKRGYCFHDDECDSGVTSHFTSCSYQGLTVGCIDDYTDSDPCQYLDVTDVPDVTTRAFTLRVTVDTDQLLPDPDRANDVAEVALAGCGDGVVQDGEACDAGPAGGGCCDPTCHLVGAGTVCRPSSGPCDGVGTCDGFSPACPVDAPVPDGTACGASGPSCLAGRCRAGACLTERDSAACVIGGACVADGASNPADRCEQCDASARPDGWSPDRDADAKGIGCAVDRVTAALSALPCGPRLTRAVATRMRQVRRVLGRDPTARRQRALVRLTQRVAGTLTRVARRRHCDAAPALAEVGGLLGQVRGFASANGAP